MIRPGAEALTLLAAPLNIHMLNALQQAPMELPELHDAIGFPPQSTMRVYSRKLEALGLLEAHRRREFPTRAEYRITRAGSSLLKVDGFLQSWLEEAPGGPIPAGSMAAKSGTKALIGGWSSNIVRGVAARPLSLSELNMLIPRISYPTLERKLRAMRSAKLVEPKPERASGVPYLATDWLRRAVVPLTSAVAWELQHLGPRRIGPTDVEAAFLLAFPLLSLGPEVAGNCRVSVEVRAASAPAYAGVLASIEGGRTVSCSSNLEGDAHVSISGTPRRWLNEMNGGPQDELHVDGNRSLAKKVTEALRALPEGVASDPVGSG